MVLKSEAEEIKTDRVPVPVNEGMDSLETRGIADTNDIDRVIEAMRRMFLDHTTESELPDLLRDFRAKDEKSKRARWPNIKTD